MAGVNSQVAWIRAIPDGASPSMSGGLASMELAHTLGVVPLARDDAFNPYHSPNLQADGQAPDRAYNVTLRSFLVDDRTAMTLSSGWNNATVVYEPPDYGALLCRLGGQPTADCTATQSGGVGTSTGVAAGPHFVMSGTTDLATAAGTDIVESYFAANVAPTRPDPASQLKLIQIKPSGPTILGVPTSELVSDHDHGGAGDETDGKPAARVQRRLPVRYDDDPRRAPAWRGRRDPPVFARSPVGAAGREQRQPVADRGRRPQLQRRHVVSTTSIRRSPRTAPGSPGRRNATSSRTAAITPAPRGSSSRRRTTSPWPEGSSSP